MAAVLEDHAGEDFFAGLMAASPFAPLAPSLLELLELGRPSWHAQAACRGRSDVSWFSPADTATATAVCGSCPVAVQCAAAGAQEPAGIWGGRGRDAHRRYSGRPARVIQAITEAAGLESTDVDLSEGGSKASPGRDRSDLSLGGNDRATQPRRKRSGPLIGRCLDCGAVGPIRSLGRCARCYRRAWRRVHGAQPRQVGRRIGPCADCQAEGALTRGLCAACYSRWLRRRQKAG